MKIELSFSMQSEMARRVAVLMVAFTTIFRIRQFCYL
jgi:hypothetical protein